MSRVIRVRPEDLALRIRVPAHPSALVSGVVVPEETIWISGEELHDVEIEVRELRGRGPHPGLAKARPRRTRPFRFTRTAGDA